MATNLSWIIKHYAIGELTGSELELVDRSIPELEAGQVLIKTMLLSLDPSNRLWLSEQPDYLPQLQIGDVMRGLVVGCVAQSNHVKFKQGDYLFAMLGWAQYAVINGDELTTANGAISFTPNEKIPLDAYISALGLTGWTAYIGMLNIGKLANSDNVLVSGAAGATGMMACQIAKASGATTVGIAGGTNKCKLLIDVLHLDGAIDYKASKVTDISAQFAKQFPDGIDLFFDNVGSSMLDAALENMAIGGRIVISGGISQYQAFGDKDQQYGLKNSLMIASKRLRMEGFLVLDYPDQLGEILPVMEQWLLDGKIQYKNTEVIGIEQAQATLPRLFSGQHVGKLVIKVA